MLTHAKGLPREQVREDVKHRARTVIEWEIVHESGLLKLHVYCNGIWGTESVLAHRELRDEYRGKIDIESIVPRLEDGDLAHYRMMRQKVLLIWQLGRKCVSSPFRPVICICGDETLLLLFTEG